MPINTPTLHLFCGKVAAGKSTLAHAIAAAPATVLIAEDHWLSRLYPDQINALEDYKRCSAQLREPMGAHVVDLLLAGLSVVLDFQANTVPSRQWMRVLIDRTGADHLLHFLDPPDRVCRDRLRRRNAAGGHHFAPSEADYDLISSYFTPPTTEEGFRVKLYREFP